MWRLECSAKLYNGHGEHTRQNNPNAQEAVFRPMDFFELFDIFRMQNPESRRYTWRSVRNGQLKQARLDYFLVSSDVTNFVHSIETLAGYRTDHSIVIINLASVSMNNNG